MELPKETKGVKRAEFTKISSDEEDYSYSQLSMRLDLKLYKRRWLILLLYVAYMTCNSAQWYQYSIISNIVCHYYHIDSWLVDLTSLIIMLCYLALAVPVAYMMDMTDLRWSAMVGVFGTALGSWVKVFSASPDGFVVTFAGQSIIALSQIFMLSVPPKLASIWFGEKEISSACSIGLFGNQLGLTVGFFLSPLMVRPHDAPAAVGSDLYTMFLTLATFTTFVSLVVFVFFRAEPTKPPTVTQAIRRAMTPPGSSTKDYFSTLNRLFTNKHIMYLFLSTGLNNGCFNALLTLLNQIFINYFPDRDQDAGKIGVTIMVSGMAASMFFAYLLDNTKEFKAITTTVYILSAVSVVTFALALESRNLIIVYMASAVLGIFLCSFTAVSFDVASELTYPESEVVTATIMNMSSLIFSIALTIGITIINNTYGYFWGNLAFALILFVGGFGMMGIKFDLRRLGAQRSGMHTQLRSPEESSCDFVCDLESENYEIS